jgi:hypothetical protein
VGRQMEYVDRSIKMTKKQQFTLSLDFNELGYDKKLKEELVKILKQNLNNVNIESGIVKPDKEYGKVVELSEDFWRNLPSILVASAFEVKRDYIDKSIKYEDRRITISNLLDEQKNIVYPKNKHIFKECHFDINIYGKNPEERDKIGKEVFKILSSLKIEKAVVGFVLTSYGFNPGFENPGKTQYGIFFRRMMSCMVIIEHKIDEKEKIEIFKEAEKKKLLAFSKDVIGEDFFNAIKSPDGKYIVAARYFIKDEKYDYDICFLDDERKIHWKHKIEGINDIAFFTNNMLVICTSLKKGEMGDEFKPGGHIYCLNKIGATLLDCKTPGVAECCAVSPKEDYFVAGTISPDKNVYCFDRKFNLLWKYRTKFPIVHIEISADGNIISVYAGGRKLDKVLDICLNREGKIISNS